MVVLPSLLAMPLLSFIIIKQSGDLIMNPNVTGLINQMQTIMQSGQNLEDKTNQVDNILTDNWGPIITSTGETNAQRLETLGMG